MYLGKCKMNHKIQNYCYTNNVFNFLMKGTSTLTSSFLRPTNNSLIYDLFNV